MNSAEKQKTSHKGSLLFCCQTRIRTQTDRTRICSATVTPFGKVGYRLSDTRITTTEAFLLHAALWNTSFLTSKIAQVVQFRATNFSVTRFAGDKERADKVYQGIKPLTGEDIAEVVYFAASAPEHVQIAEVLVLATHQASGTIVHRKA